MIEEKTDALYGSGFKVGAWMRTHSGIQFDLSDPKPAMVTLEDIAFALGNIVRFTGHVSERWTVAHHSVLVALLMREAGATPLEQMGGLFHDAAEAYVNDLSSPMKVAMAQYPGGAEAYKAVEAKVVKAISRRFDLHESFLHSDQVKAADLGALAVESRDYLPGAVSTKNLPEAHKWHAEIHMAYAETLYGAIEDGPEILPDGYRLFKRAVSFLRREIGQS